MATWKYGISNRVVQAMAEQAWPDIELGATLYELIPGIYYIHGKLYPLGYIADTNICTELKRFNIRTQNIRATDQHYAAFNQSAEALLVEWLYPEVSKALLLLMSSQTFKNGERNIYATSNHFTLAVQQRMFAVQQILLENYPGLIRQYSLAHR